MKRWFFSLLVLFSVTTAAWSQSLPPEVVRYADAIVHNGKVYTMDDKSNSANAGAVVEAVAVRDGKILLAATNKQVLALRGPQTRVIDAKGRTVVPGIIDTHSHLFDYAMDSLGEGSPRLRVRAEQNETWENVKQKTLDVIRQEVEETQAWRVDCLGLAQTGDR